jgi:hypothetical protein
MDTEPGGENTQYEGAKVFKDQIPPASKVANPNTTSQFGMYSSINTFNGINQAQLYNFIPCSGI